MYLAIVYDRRQDPFYAVSENVKEAMVWARKHFKECMNEPEHIDYNPVRGYVWHASLLDNYAAVIEVKVLGS